MKYFIYTSKMHNQGIYLSVCVNKVLIKYRIENFDLATKKCSSQKRNALHEITRSYTREMLTLVTMETNVNVG